MEWAPFILSLKLALVTTIILCVIALPLAKILAFSSFKGKPVVESLVSLPLLLPPSVLGFYFLILFHPSNIFGQLIDQMFGLRLVFTFEGLVMASVIYSLPFMVSPIQTGLQNLPSSLREMSFSMGKSEWWSFFNVLLPNIKISLLSAFALTFAHVIGEFGVVLMLGGSIPNETRVASIAIFDEVEALNYTSAHQYAAVLLVFSFSVLLFINYLKKVKNWNLSLITKKQSSTQFLHAEIEPKSVENIAIDFRKKFEQQEINLQFNFKSNQIIGLTGPSGAGKTSLLKGIAGLSSFSEGEMNWGKEPWNKATRQMVSPQCRKLGVVFQDYALFPHLNVQENLCFSLQSTNAFYDELVEKLELEELLDQYPNTLSGGQQQRVAIGRALLMNPNFILLDEPFSALDFRLKKQVVEFLLASHKKRNTGMLIVSHEVELLNKICDKVFLIHEGKLVTEAIDEPLNFKLA
ncbi:molybdate ABC transporter permease subunit [Sediminitomix flava]|uniref:Molybdenum transport system permease protein ModB n=1 Tax=Sediminitomix flava TaxID=379075 RepID=A0A315ZGN9_SEDFL|nr:molybdate ABC transporter permease subunit [Sediminitomix flava]PWJ44333.1 molybdate ABC transporter permease protein [Sediminitomix flava]